MEAWHKGEGRIYGRDDELATVDDGLRAAREGRGATVAFVGEAGIGKSHLLEESIERARNADMVVLVGRATPAGGAYRALAAALAGWARSASAEELTSSDRLRPYRAALARVLPDFPVEHRESPTRDADPVVEVGEGILRLLVDQGRGRGAVLALDDLQWADPDTIAVLDYLTESVAGQPLLILLASREDRTPTGLARRLDRQPGARVRRVERLDPQAAEQLARASSEGEVRAEALRSVLARADGLPLLVTELARTAARRRPDNDELSLPDTFRALVEEQFAEVPKQSRALLQAAAVAGVDLGWQLLATAAGVTPSEEAEALEAALASGLLTRTETGEAVWRHALTAEAVLGTALPPHRERLAGRAAALLVKRRTPDADAIAASLFLLAGDAVTAGDLLLELAQADIDSGALWTARRRLDQLEEIARPSPRAVIQRIRLLTLTGEADAALAAGSDAVDRAIGDEHAELCYHLARACIVAGRWSEAKSYIERAGRPDDARGAVVLADAAYGGGDPQSAATLAEGAIRRAEDASDAALLTGALLVAGRAHAHTDPAAASAAFKRAVQVAAEVGHVDLRVTGLLGLATIEALERPDPPSLIGARELAAAHGLHARVASLEAIAADLTLVSGGPQVALPIAQASIELAERLKLGSVQSAGELYAAYALAEFGDGVRAEELLAAATARPEAALEIHAGASIVRAISAAVNGDAKHATDLADEAAAMLARHASAYPVHWWGFWLLLRAITSRDFDSARRTYEAAHASRRQVNDGAAAFADAVIAGRRGAHEECMAAIEQGDSRLQGHAWWHRFLRVQLWSVAAPEGWADPVPSLRADLAWLEQHEAEALARRCRDLLRVAGAPVRRTPGRWVPPTLRSLGVTSREAEVLMLVAQGLSNADVADRLFVSVRTVETHVSQLLLKTDSVARTDLKRYAAELPPTEGS